MVKLVVEDDWMSVCYGWSGTEQTKRCRRVAFNSYVADGKVKASIAYVDLRPAVCISYINCLSSSDHARHYFIGTDALNALESMLQVELTADDRKALRNKFERYKCQVIRKDQDYDGLFEVFDRNHDIKPRNLQKGVRIYRWDQLSDFLVDLASKTLRDSKQLASLSAFAPSSAIAGCTPYGMMTALNQISPLSPGRSAHQQYHYGQPIVPNAQQLSYQSEFPYDQSQFEYTTSQPLPRTPSIATASWSHAVVACSPSMPWSPATVEPSEALIEEFYRQYAMP